MNATSSSKLANAGAVGSAIAASICCFGPLLLALLGLGGGALLLKLEPYRPFFLGASALFLGAGFYLAYRPPVIEECESGSACAIRANPEGNYAYCSRQVPMGQHSVSVTGTKITSQSCDVGVGQGGAEAHFSKGERVHCLSLVYP